MFLGRDERAAGIDRWIHYFTLPLVSRDLINAIKKNLIILIPRGVTGA